MDFERFEPVYEAILADFGFPRESDECARDVLVDLEPGARLDAFAVALGGRDVAVVAPGPSLVDALEGGALERNARGEDPDAVVAVSSAAPVLREHGVAVDAYVTDLDADPERAAELTYDGVPTAMHAHGDNLPAVREHVPKCDREFVLGTTQAAPVDVVVNVGGFTDGDRAAFLADAVGARSLSFPGWDLADPDLNELKAKKLRWAARLLFWLERDRRARLDRDVHFDVLDGLRGDLAHPAIPDAN